ncbi:DUF1765-domain-containing protein [Xylona heveae TC161]|uniref:DUF1765-domain-containing protein n=1 Tax=Xylona heveae (strain CBS 132557 / TC161) TaxID=1328760 RepID=A0A165A0J8_XYLHT|nr:DUF1765-domain-containing protein [Xylona heveae TC161]KZF19778.1 DUF1765-domain-containing protein [Xylona heveae TC161]
MSSGAAVLDGSVNSLQQNLQQEIPQSTGFDFDFTGSKALQETYTEQIPRSASYTYLPLPPDRKSDELTQFTIKRTFSENQLASPVEEKEIAWPEVPPPAAVDGISLPHRRKSSRAYARPKLTLSKFSLSSERTKGDSSPSERNKERNNTSQRRTNGQREARPRPLSTTLSSLSRKTWSAPSSRSTSPTNRKADVLVKPDGVVKEEQEKKEQVKSVEQVDKAEEKPVLERPTAAFSRRRSLLPRRLSRMDLNKDLSLDAVEDGKQTPPVRSRDPSPTKKKSKRPLSGLFKLSTEPADLPSVPSLPKSFSTDRLTSSNRSQASTERIPPLSLQSSSEQLHQHRSSGTPRKKDELWSAFRALDGDFNKFQSKSTALKANVVRSSLLPFLRNYVDHPSIKFLRPEDLDRRIIILNKWWIGLLELLNGRNNQTISGTDRPVILDAIAGIMGRPEWRPPASPLSALADRSVKSTKSPSSTSLSSSGSDFLAESVYHNVRNTFVQNLLAQMAFVVEKMSLRHAPASLVTFCGKATAFAFFFCPGVADVLVRLWNIPSSSMFRLLEEYGLPKSSNLSESSQPIVQGFPPCLHSLGFVSVASMAKYLRMRPLLPLGASDVPWYGPWVSRWSGRESDLLFVFVKQFHVLLVDYLPPNTDRSERICAPGVILVHSQLLSTLDSTFHRDANSLLAGNTAGALPTTFDDFLNGADASAAVLPLPPANAIRPMAENRLIMLLRDFLADKPTDSIPAREVFSEGFFDLLAAAARKTSLYNHSACFLLCDFLEEAIAILTRYQQFTNDLRPLINWPFWFEVCQKMMQSHNSMTEIRVIAFIYSSWNIVTRDESRKRDLCLGWLLSEDFFEKYFNHWCPMVRAYYMRLLCWRLARYDGDATTLDYDIFETLSMRLRAMWSYYLHLKSTAEKLNLMPPSTAPCSPAPGRRLVIIRNDTQMNPTRAFFTFDGIIPASSSYQASTFPLPPSPASSTSSTSTQSAGSNGVVSKPSAEQQGTPGKKKWSFFKSIFPSSTSSNDTSKTKMSNGSANRLAKPNEAASGQTATSQQNDQPSTPEKPSTVVNKAPNSTISVRPPPYRNYSFKFSLDWIDMYQYSSKDRRLYPPRLPMPAQMFLQSKRAEPFETDPRQPEGQSIGHSRYAGRALAEWAMIVIECQNFFERRKGEGVPGNRYIETPTLGVDNFRKLG